MDEDTLSFYSSQSIYSDPVKYSKLYTDLPNELLIISEVLRGLVIPFDMLEKVPADRQTEMNARHVRKILARILELSDEPLTVNRQVSKRFLGCCRDLSLLLCSILRHKGVPARLRSGFAPYINIGAPGFNPEHIVAEVWEPEKGRWRAVDPSQNDELIKVNNIDFDVTDIPTNKFLIAGEVWRGYRDSKLDPDLFGVEPDSPFKGVSMIRNRLIQDFHMINKHELLIWDSTPFMDLHIEPTDDDLGLLDIVAEVCNDRSNDLNLIQEVYESEARLQISKVVSTYCPFDAPRVIDLTKF